jgi:hypothetical protein
MVALREMGWNCIDIDVVEGSTSTAVAIIQFVCLTATDIVASRKFPGLRDIE